MMIHNFKSYLLYADVILLLSENEQGMQKHLICCFHCVLL